MGKLRSHVKCTTLIKTIRGRGQFDKGRKKQGDGNSREKERERDKERQSESQKRQFQDSELWETWTKEKCGRDIMNY